MDKKHILDEIRRTAKENGGEPLGYRRFQSEVRIKESDWSGKFWTKWSDAVVEAGLIPNELPEAKSINTEDVIEQAIGLIRSLKKFPTVKEWQFASRNDDQLASHQTLRRRVGQDKSTQANAILNYCRDREGYEDITEICEAISTKPDIEPGNSSAVNDGYVYLMKSGKFHKVGLSNSPGRRKYELESHRPEGIEIVHTIKTDDPEGIEAYWHKRFRDKRQRGEWFDLTRDDVKAFKRRKFM